MDLASAVNAPVAGPAVQVAGGLSCPGVGIGPDHVRCDEGLAGSQGIGGGMGVDTRDDVELSGVVVFETQAEVAAPGEGAGNDFAGRLAEFSRIQTQHERRVVSLCGLDAAPRFDDLGVVSQQFAFHLHFGGPAAPGVGEQVFVGIEMQGGGGVVEQFHGFLAAVDDFGMGHDDIFFLVGFVDEYDRQGRDGIAEHDFRREDAGPVFRGMAGVVEFGVVAAVGIAHVEGRGADEHAASSGDGHRSGTVRPGKELVVVEECPGGVDPGSVVAGSQIPGVVRGQDQLGMVCLNENVCFVGPGGKVKAQEGDG